MIHPVRSVMKDEISKERVLALTKANALMDVMFSSRSKSNLRWELS